MSQSNFNLSRTDLIAIRLAMGGKSPDDYDVSVAAKMIIDMLRNPLTQREAYHAITENEELVTQIELLNSDGAPPTEPNSLLENFVWLYEVKEIVKPQYLIDSYPFYAKGFNLLIGRAGARKSLTAVDFIAQAAESIRSRNFLYVAGEGYTGLLARMKGWEQHHKLQLRNLAVMRGELQFKDPVKVEQFENLCEDLDIAFVVVDTLQTVTVGMDENSTKEMSIFCESVRSMCQRLDIGILFVHHLNKQDQYRGSSVIMASADSVLRSIVNDDGLVTLHNSLAKGGKNKDNEEHEPIHKRVLSLEMEMSGEMESIGVLEDASKVIDAPGTVTGNAKTILDFLLPFSEGLQAKEIVDGTGISQSSVYYSLKRLMEDGFVVSKHEKYKITHNGRQIH